MVQTIQTMRLADVFSSVTSFLSAVVLVFCLANCFFGYRLLKVWITLCGFCIGAGIGCVASWMLSDNQWVISASTLVAGLIAAVLAYEVYLIGVFLYGWLAVTGAVVLLVRPMKIPDRTKLFLMAGGVVLGIVVGVILVIFARPSIILSTGISGGMGAAAAFVSLMGEGRSSTVLLAGGALSLLGIWLQFQTTKDGHGEKRKKKRAASANRVRNTRRK